MDALRWILLAVGVLVLVGIYAWGKRERLLAWWQGHRGEEVPRFDEDDEDLSDELRRLKDLMDADNDEHPRQRAHVDADMDVLDEAYGVEISVPRPVRPAQTGDDAGAEPDVLLDAARAKAASAKSSQANVQSKSRPITEVPVSAPRPASAETMARKPAPKIEVGTRPRPVTAPFAPPAKPAAGDFLLGTEAVSKPRVRKVVETPSVDTPPSAAASGVAATPVESSPLPPGAVSVEPPVPAAVPAPPSVAEAAPPQPVPEPAPRSAPVPVTSPVRHNEPPTQVSLDLGDDPPPAEPGKGRREATRRLDTVIVDGEVFDTRRAATADAGTPTAGDDHAAPPSPGLSEIGGRVLGWFKGLGEAAREHLPKRPEPPVHATPELIQVVHVMAHQGSHFTGEEVREALRALKLNLGDSGLYEVLPKHRATTTPVVCVANMLEPGVLSDDELMDLQTPGLSLFLRLPGPVEGGEALEVLLTTAQGISRHLNGELRDQSRNRLTRQTITHMHEQVLEHARRMQIALSRRR